jgi:hypothetical protein
MKEEKEVKLLMIYVKFKNGTSESFHFNSDGDLKKHIESLSSSPVVTIIKDLICVLPPKEPSKPWTRKF